MEFVPLYGTNYDYGHSLHPRTADLPRGGPRLHRRPATLIHSRTPSSRPPSEPGRHHHLAAHPGRARLVGAALAEGIRWRRLEPSRAADPAGRALSRSSSVATDLQYEHAGAGSDEVRHVAAARTFPAQAGEPGPMVLPRLLRAGRRFGPGGPAHQRSPRGGFLHRQRAENLDIHCAVGRLDLRPGAHRSASAQAGWYFFPADRPEVAGDYRAADPFDRRHQPRERSVFRGSEGA